MLRLVSLHNSVNALLSSCSAVLSHPTRHHSCGASRDYLLPALRIPHFVQHSWESSSLRHSFGELKFPSSQAVLRYRTAIATFFRENFGYTAVLSFLVYTFSKPLKGRKANNGNIVGGRLKRFFYCCARP